MKYIEIYLYLEKYYFYEKASLKNYIVDNAWSRFLIYHTECSTTSNSHSYKAKSLLFLKVFV